MPAAKGRAARAARRPRLTQAPSRTRSRSITLLIVGPMLCALALTGLAYLGLSQQAQRDTLAQVGVAAQAASGAIRANMGDLTLTNGQLTSALPANVTTLNNNNAEAKQLRTLVGVDTLIAQRQPNGFIVIASSMAQAGDVGATLGGSLAANACADSGSPTAGALTVGGVGYIAGAAPLMDGSGACVGAVIALTPVSAMQQVTLEYTVILAMAGALLALVTVAIGLTLTGREQAAQASLADGRLRVAIDALTATQTHYTTQRGQREWVGRRIDAARDHLERLMTTLANDRVALQEATSDVWAGVSHPGAPVDPATAMRLARENAVVAARIGSRLNEVDIAVADLFANLDASDEFDQMLEEALAQTESAIADLRGLIAPSSSAPLAAHSSDPFATNVLEAQRRRTSQAPRIAPQPAPGVSRFTGGQQAVRRDSGQYRVAPGDSAQRRAIRPDASRPGQSGQYGQTGQYRTLFNQGASGKHPAAHGPQQPGASGSQRAQRQEASSSGRHLAQQPPQPPTPRNAFDVPQDGRERGSSGSRWLND